MHTQTKRQLLYVYQLLDKEDIIKGTTRKKETFQNDESIIRKDTRIQNHMCIQ